MYNGELNLGINKTLPGYYIKVAEWSQIIQTSIYTDY